MAVLSKSRRLCPFGNETLTGHPLHSLCRSDLLLPVLGLCSLSDIETEFQSSIIESLYPGNTAFERIWTIMTTI
jgi:hypothetical protein